MSDTKDQDIKKEETKEPTLYPFYVGKYDLTVQAANAKEAVKLAKKQSKKEGK